jgi:hypothetical protein
MIVPTANYPTSRNYRQLWELAHTAAVACIVDMDHGKPDTCRDIARTTHSPEWSPELVQVGSRGIGHVWAESLEAFIAGCEQCNLEWLVPPAALAAEPEGEGPKLRAALQRITAHRPIMGSTGDYRQGQLDILGSVQTIATTALETPAAPPAPEAGEVGELWALAAALRDPCIAPLLSERTRAATLLQQLSAPASAAVPVAVSERPWEKGDWADLDGECWWCPPDGPAYWSMANPAMVYGGWLLPAHAIPLPQDGEVSNV